MQTSYFAKYRGENGVSIALYPPKGYKGRQYTRLTPPSWLLKRYKVDKDESFYINMYEMYLRGLDPQEVYNELGENAVLLCYEKSGDFCHRRLVAKWLENELGIKVEEIKYK